MQTEMLVAGVGVVGTVIGGALGHFSTLRTTRLTIQAQRLTQAVQIRNEAYNVCAGALLTRQHTLEVLLSYLLTSVKPLGDAAIAQWREEIRDRYQLGMNVYRQLLEQDRGVRTAVGAIALAGPKSVFGTALNAADAGDDLSERVRTRFDLQGRTLDADMGPVSPDRIDYNAFQSNLRSSQQRIDLFLSACNAQLAAG